VVSGIGFLLELAYLKGREKLNRPFTTLLTF
jgi:hypothetical protein